MRRKRNQSPLCEAQSSRGFVCTLKAGHDGGHTATGPDDRHYQVWSDEAIGGLVRPLSFHTSSNASYHFGIEAADPPRESLKLEQDIDSQVRVGFRTWALRRSYPHGVQLVSDSYGKPWPHRQRVEATCGCQSENPVQAMGVALTVSFYSSSWPWADQSKLGKHDDVAPSPACTCGIYALSSEVELPVKPGQPVVAGSVYLWGRVIEHAKGYRAQYAYPRELVLIGGDSRLAMALELAYGVIVECW